VITGACVFSLALVSPAAAFASEVEVNPGPRLLTYTAFDGEANRFQISREARPAGDVFVITDSGTAGGAPITIVPIAPYCSVTTTRGQVTCLATEVASIRVNLNDGDDTAALGVSDVPIQVRGGAGADAINGGTGPDVLLGEEGADSLSGDAGDDRLDGGTGADTIDGGPGADRISCGVDAVVDTVRGDAADEVSDCAADAVSISNPPPPPSPTGTSPSPTPRPVVTTSLDLLNPFPIVRLRGSATRSGARISLLSVRSPAGARVEVRCRGRSCPRTRVAATSVNRSVRFRQFHRYLRAGVILEVRVSKPDTIGKYVRFTIRKGGRSPLRRDLCLRPGSQRPVPCSAL